MSQAALVIENGKVVSLAYQLTNKAGDVLDESSVQDPFMFIQGSGQVIPGLETALMGLKKGDKKKVQVEPAEGYGELDPKLKMTVKRSQFPKGVELEQGMQFEASGPQGDSIFTVISFTDNEVTIDGNHPLAGETLNFDVEVLEIRDATEEEEEHGHVHGPGGHHHH